MIRSGEATGALRTAERLRAGVLAKVARKLIASGKAPLAFWPHTGVRAFS